MDWKAWPLLGVFLAVISPAWGATNGAARDRVLMIDDMEVEGVRPRFVTNQVRRPGTNALGSGVLLIDDMEGVDSTNSFQSGPEPVLKNLGTVEESEDSTEKNRLGGRTGVYQQAPSKAEATRGSTYGMSSSGLRISYAKKNKGGPNKDGGFCGYYSVLHSGFNNYLDASDYHYITFWVRGEKGGEDFKLGAADKKWHLQDDTLKGKSIGAYLPAGKITTKWQRAVIPTSDFPLNWKAMHGLSICFEGELYPDGAGTGVIFIDDLAFTKDRPADAQTEKPGEEERSKDLKPPASKEKKRPQQKMDEQKEGPKPSPKAA